MKLNNVTFSYKEFELIKNFSLNIEPGKVTAILGPSGCGKSTLLKLIAGLIRPSQGFISDTEKSKSYIFQEHRLLPWMSLIENVNYPLQREDKKRANYYIEKMGLWEHRKKFPSQLSGGMAQRVSISRALAYKSNYLLMDEPFKGLDIELKSSVFKHLNRLISEENRTTIFVTHDITESIILGDNIVILEDTPVTIKKEIRNSVPLDCRLIGHNDVEDMKEVLSSFIINKTWKK